MLRLVLKKFSDLSDSVKFMPKVIRRRIYIGLSVVTSIFTTGSYVSLHTINSDWLVKQLRMYRMKMPVPVKESLNELAQQVADESDLEFVYPFYLFNFFGSDVYSIGSLKLPTGGYIGIPFNYNYNSKKELRVETLRFLGRFKTKLSQDSPVMKKLVDSLILSEDAKKYVIAQQIHLLNSSYFFVKSSNILAQTLFYFWCVPKFNRMIGLNQSRLVPRVMGGVLMMFAITFLTLVTDEALDHIYDIRALKKTVKESRYQSGAKEFYEKLIARNQALFELLNDYGPSFYTPDGETKKLFGLRRISYEKHLAIVNSKSGLSNS